MSRAYNLGFRRGLYALKMQARNVCVDCRNPYKTHEYSSQWLEGFFDAYYRRKT